MSLSYAELAHSKVSVKELSLQLPFIFKMWWEGIKIILVLVWTFYRQIYAQSTQVLYTN